MGTQASGGAKVLLMIFLWVYICCCTRNFFDNDKDQKTKHTATVIKGTEINKGHKVRRQSISQERGSWLSGFVVRRMFTERNPRMRFHPMTSVLGAVCCSTGFHYQELIRNRGFMRDRKQHTGILLLNVPWQCWGKSKLMGECYPSWHLKVFNSSFDHVGYNESAFWTCFKTGRIWTLSSW